MYCQTGGRMDKRYDGLMFVSIRAADHKVPLHRPQLALVLVKAFMSGTAMPTPPQCEEREGIRWYINLEDLMRFRRDNEAQKIMRLIEGAQENEKVNAFRERRAIAMTLNDMKMVVNKLHHIFNMVVSILIGVLWLLILGIATKQMKEKLMSPLKIHSKPNLKKKDNLEMGNSNNRLTTLEMTVSDLTFTAEELVEQLRLTNLVLGSALVKRR
ncbi:hypothetical protein GIB67_016674 [Kingdonia uniflora]|uniref:Transmembrane protein n=1 Tax=Kingdonia uniflora TaxID=39325 RepID=A0A7J7ME80_9MAGN|nr:hypothetical protein GIB67_016674 [Kingdonia uniflora]